MIFGDSWADTSGVLRTKHAFPDPQGAKLLPPTIYADLPIPVTAVVLCDGTCVFNRARSRIAPLVLTFTDYVPDERRVLAAALGYTS